MKKHFFFAALVFFFLGALLPGQTCQVTNTFNPARPAAYEPQKCAAKADKSYFYVLGGNFIASYNNSNPAQPMLVNTTPNYCDTCGDGCRVVRGMAMFPGDTMIFETTNCHGVRAYDISNAGNFSEKAYANVNNSVIGAIVTGGKRYLIMGMSGLWYYADYSNPGANGQKQDFSTFSGISRSAGQIDSFVWQGRVFIALTDTTNGLSVYDVTSFPSNITQVYNNTSLRLYGSYFYNGHLFAACQKSGSNPYGLLVFSVPSFQIVGTFTDADFSSVGRPVADDRYAYVSRGGCVPDDNGGYTGGFLILNIQNLNNIYNVLSPDFIPYGCPGTGAGDFVSTYYQSKYYFYVAGVAGQSVYEIGSCGSSANVVLETYTPSHVDPGGTYTLSITLQNTGNAEAPGVTAALSTTDTAYVTVNSPVSQNFGVIAAGGAALRDYSFTVASNAPASTIPFHLAISSSAGSFSADFSVSVNAPHPNLVRSVSGTAARPGMDVTYTNTGNSDYTGTFSAGVSTWTTDVTVSPASQTFGPIAKDHSQTHTYAFTLPAPSRATCASPDFVSVHMTVSDSSVANSPADFSTGIAGDGNYPLVYYSSASLASASGTYTLTLNFQNNGAAAASNVQVDLAADNPDLAFITSMPVGYGSMAVGQTVSRQIQFSAPTDASGTVNFTASVTSDQGCWTYYFAQNLTSLQFAYVDEKHCGCGINCSTLHPDIFEGATSSAACMNFSYKLTNTGTSTANNVPATLAVLNTNQSAVSVTVNSSTYTLASGASGFNNSPQFQVSLTSDYCSGTTDNTCPTLKLLLSIPDYGFSKEIDYTVHATGGTTTACVLSYKTGSLAIKADGNSDGTANPGEAVQFTLQVQNTGTADAPSTLGTISAPSSQSQYVSIQNATASYGTVVAGGNTTSSSNYKITLTSDAPTGIYYFPISITSQCSATAFTGTVALTVQPLAGDVTLAYQSYAVQDPSPGGDGYGILDPGETATLMVSLMNSSGTAISGATATLATTASGVAINSQGSFTAMAGRSGTAAFGITLSSSYGGSTIPFTIAVAGATVTNPGFSVAVGTAPPTITLTYQSATIDDSTTGNNDGTWKPGETVKVIATLANTSSTAVSGAAATLTSSASGVTVNAQGTYTAAVGGTGTATFTVSLSSGYTGSTVPFGIAVAGATVTNPSFTVPVYTAPPPVQALVIPVVAHASGAQGTNWKTDLNIFNTTTSTAQYTLKLIKAQTANDIPPQGTFQISPGGNLILLDVLNNPSLPSF
jgi:hypothetical protein